MQHSVVGLLVDIDVLVKDAQDEVVGTQAEAVHNPADWDNREQLVVDDAGQRQERLDTLFSI